MILEILPKGGIGAGEPTILEASQVLIKQADGTPIGVAAEYGPEGTYAVSYAGEPDFNRILSALGIDQLVITDELHTAGDGGAVRLVKGDEK